jgi:hypothetical protein
MRSQALCSCGLAWRCYCLATALVLVLACVREGAVLARGEGASEDQAVARKPGERGMRTACASDAARVLGSWAVEGCEGRIVVRGWAACGRGASWTDGLAMRVCDEFRKMTLLGDAALVGIPYLVIRHLATRPEV